MRTTRLQFVLAAILLLALVAGCAQPTAAPTATTAPKAAAPTSAPAVATTAPAATKAATAAPAATTAPAATKAAATTAPAATAPAATKAAATAPAAKAGAGMKFVFASDAVFPPMEYVDETTKQIMGFDIDLINAIAKDQGFTVEIKNTAWEGIFAGLEGGEYDAILSSVTITDERKEEVRLL